MANKISSFRDLKAWQESHSLALSIYRLTRYFPKEEIYGLTNQMRRCAVSVPSNIAEGFARQGSREKTQFYYVAKALLTELESQLLLAKDLGYIAAADSKDIESNIDMAGRLLTGLVRSIKSSSK